MRIKQEAFKIKAYIYGRYSSHNQKDASIAQQFAEIRTYCQKNGIQIIGEYADRAISGKTDNRPQFQKMIKDAARGHVQVIVCWKVDRFARNREDAAVYKGRLRRYGVRVMYAAEPIAEGSAGILLEGMLEATAEWYSATLSENIKRGMLDNARKCMVNNGNLPLGYKKGADGKYAIESTGAAIVRNIFSMYASGKTVTQIGNELNARGCRTSRGSTFNKNSLRTMLKNERYTGVYIYANIRIEGGIPQIISRGLFDKVQNQIEKTKRAPAATKTAVDYLLTGKIFCGHCDSGMVGESGTGKSGNKFNYYICAKKKREKACDKSTVKKGWIEQLIIDLTVEKVLTDEMIEKLATVAVELQQQEKEQSPLVALQNSKTEMDATIKNVMSAIEQGIITETTKTRLHELEAQRADLELQIIKESALKVNYTKKQMIYWLEKFREGKDSDKDFGIRIIEIFINSVYLYNDHVRIVYNFTPDTETVPLELVKSIDSDTEQVFGLACNGGASYVKSEPHIYIFKRVFMLVAKLP